MIYTIGHSTHSFDEFVDILNSFQITQLIDVRTIPRSRRNPQFNKHSLVQTLPKRDIDYRHIKELGGLRPVRKNSPNQGWHNTSFRGYADHMQTDEFQAGLKQLIDAANQKTTAIMCAEAVPWRCHRSMVGDALLVHGFEVSDIFSAGKAQPEKLTSFAKVVGTSITYPTDEEQ